MSIEQLAICLHHSRSAATTKLVLLGIANHDGDGGSWPSLATLAKYAVCNERNVRNHLRRLERLGEIRTIHGAGGNRRTVDHERPNLYEVLLRCPSTCDRTAQHRHVQPPVSVTVVDGVTEIVVGVGGSRPTPRGGSRPTPRGGSRPTPEPSLEPSLEPSTQEKTPSGPTRPAAETHDVVTAFASSYKAQTGTPAPRNLVGTFAGVVANEPFAYEDVLDAMPLIVEEIGLRDEERPDDYASLLDTIELAIGHRALQESSLHAPGALTEPSLSPARSWRTDPAFAGLLGNSS